MKNPYVFPIIFFILAIVSLILLVVLLYYYNQNHQCRLNPNIWCWDDFMCSGSTLTPSALYGPTSTAGTICYNPGFTGPTGATATPGCTCGWSNNPNINAGCGGTYDPQLAY